MSMPGTITEPPAPTRPQQGQAAGPLLHAGQFRVAVGAGSSVQPTREVATQLRQRLRPIALVAAVAFAAFMASGLPFAWQRLLAEPLKALNEPPCYGLGLLIAALEGILAWQLSSRRPASLARLRTLEWLVVAPVVAYFAWNGTLSFLAGLPSLDLSPRTTANAESLAWVVCIVAYGVLLPNTARRCAAAVGLIALAGFLPDVCVLLVHDIPARLAVLYLTCKLIWLGVAGAIVVYGAYRIEILRNEALEARKLGQYLLKERLGAGGMGEVYLAEHVLLRRPCAVKLIPADRAGVARDLRRFEREVQATATLTHPNTVQIFDYGHAEDGTFYYVMEYLPGLTLDQLVKRHGPLPPARAIHFLRQVCAALREAHGIGLVHRDVKPGNVMVCERGGLHDTIKLLDFGLVLPQGKGADGERLTQEQAIMGTPAFMSPEQAGGQEALDARSDIYSVGALAYFLLTGRPPFTGGSPLQTLAAHLYEQPAPLRQQRPDIPGDVEAVVLRCLAKKPADRFPDAESLGEALAGCGAANQWSEKEAAEWWRAATVNGGATPP
jgi:serine/threonine-protein kinase